MVKILVTPDEVRRVADQFRKCSDDSQAMVQTLSSAVGSLQQNWAGMSSERFYEEYGTWRKAMDQFVTLLDGINQQLLATAQRFEMADQPD